MEFGHEGLTEPHDLALGAAARIEVGSSLSSPDGQAGQRVLERLLEAEKLDDADIDGRVEAQPSLVGPESRVELHPETAIDPHLSGIVDPRHAKDDLSLRLAEPLDQAMVGVAGMFGDDAAETSEHFLDCLMEFFFAGVTAENFSKDGFQLFVDVDHD